MAKITVHRALAQIKTTEARIEKELLSAYFLCVGVEKSGKTINGVEIKAFQKDALAAWDRLTGLIRNYDKLRRAIIRSNSGAVNPKTVKVCGEDYTVAELICKQRPAEGWLKFQKALLGRLSSEKNVNLKALEKYNEKVNERMDNFLASFAGGDKNKLSAAEIQEQSRMYRENNEAVLIDPLDITKKIEELSTMIDEFVTEADSALAEQNALTTIEVDLTA